MSQYQTNLYQQTCTCPAGQYGRPCKHLREAQQVADRETALIASAQARWAAAEAAVQAARTVEIATNRWSASYPRTD